MAGSKHTKKGKKMHGQSAIEYLITYSWAILIVAIAAVLIYFYATSQTAAVPTRCSFSQNVQCSDIEFGGISGESNAVLLLSNPSSYPIVNPQLIVNVGNAGNATGTCSPSYVLPGGTFYCTTTVPGKFTVGSTQFANIYLKTVPCQSGNALQCGSETPQTYSGTFQTQYQPNTASISPVIILSIANTTTYASIPDRLSVHVMIGNSIVEGASLSFTANTPGISFSPSMATTDSNGDAYSYLNASQSGNSLVTVSFGTYSNVILVNVLSSGYTVTFQENGAWSSSNILTIDGVTYSTSQLPVTLTWQPGSSHEYSYGSSPTPPNSISGCGISSISGLLAPSFNCTVNAIYITPPPPPSIGLEEVEFPQGNGFHEVSTEYSGNIIWCGSAAPNNALWTGGSSPSVNCPSQAPIMLTSGPSLIPFYPYNQPGTYIMFACDKVTTQLDCSTDNTGAGEAGVLQIGSSGNVALTALEVGAQWGPGTG